MKKSEAIKRLDAIENEAKELREIIEKSEYSTKKRVVDSVNEIEDKDWYISSIGVVQHGVDSSPNQLSTKERAKAFLALMQLVEIHAAIEQDVEFPHSILTVVSKDRGKLFEFYFDSIELKQEFKTKHQALIETVKRGL